MRVYKVVFPNGDFAYEMKEKDGSGCMTAESVRKVAELSRQKIIRSHTNAGPVSKWHDTIDFAPFHDIECPSGSVVRRCLPLEIMEQENFWKYFSTGESTS